jgi:uncharacterized protein
MAQAKFQISANLRFFLSADHQEGAIGWDIGNEDDDTVAVKHAVESLGVPHTEVDEIVANGCPVDFAYRLAAGDVIEVRAMMPKPDRVNLRPPLPRPVRFVVDTHLGRLAAYLRLLGFDTLYQNNYSDPLLASLSQQEERVLLTRDRGLLKRRIVEFGCCVRETDPQQQLIGLIYRYRLAAEIHPWRRCLRCNAVLEPVSKAEVLDHLEPKTKRYFDDFRRCEGCRRIYWAGSHYDRMQRFIDQVLDAALNQPHLSNTVAPHD